MVMENLKDDNMENETNEFLKVYIPTLYDSFVKNFKQMSIVVHQNAVEKGFWNEPRNKAEMLCLIHSEISEALEALRSGNPPDDKIKDFSGLEAELADVVIRVMDMAEGLDLKLSEAIKYKIMYNANRPKLHGRKF